MRRSSAVHWVFAVLLASVSGCEDPFVLATASSGAGGGTNTSSTQTGATMSASTSTGSGPGACADPHALCETFDTGAWGPGWTKQASQTTVVVDSTAAASPPDALHASCGGGSCANRTGMITYPIPRETGMNTLTCTAQVQLDGFNGGANRILDAFGLSIRMCSQSCDYTIQLAHVPNGGASLHNYIHDGVSIVADADVPLSVGFSIGGWHKVEIKATYGASSTLAAITIDGSLGSMQTLPVAPANSPVLVLAGVSYTHGTTTDWEMHVDDIVCDWSP